MAPMLHEILDVAGLDDAYLNEAMNLLRMTRDPKTPDHLLSIALDHARTDRARAYAVQHLGLSFGDMNPLTDSRVCSGLIPLADSSTPNEIRREVLWAFAQPHAKDLRIRAIAEKAVTDYFKTGPSSVDAELAIRLCSKLHLTQYRGELQRLSKDGDLRAVATEALAEMDAQSGAIAQ